MLANGYGSLSTSETGDYKLTQNHDLAGSVIRAYLETPNGRVYYRRAKAGHRMIRCSQDDWCFGWMA